MHTAYSEDISGISLQKLLSKKAKCHSEMKFRHAAQVNLFAGARCNLSIFVDSEAKKRSTLSITSCLSRDLSRGAENLDRILHPVCNDPCRATVFQGQSSIPRISGCCVPMVEMIVCPIPSRRLFAFRAGRTSTPKTHRTHLFIYL